MGLLTLMSSSLVPLEVVDQAPRLGIRRQLLGAREQRQRRALVSTPLGHIEVVRAGSSLVVRGHDVPTAALRDAGHITAATLKAGMVAQVGDITVTIRRSRFGLSRRRRTIHIEDGGQLCWFTVFRRSRDFELRRCHDRSAILCVLGEGAGLDASATPNETALAILVWWSGLVETSSLLHYLTTP
jgi:hypothetical protein